VSGDDRISPEDVPGRLESAAVGHWLIFADHGGVGAQLATLLRSRGQHCDLVFAGETYQRQGEHQVQLCPGRLDDLRQLLRDIPAPESTTSRNIVHLWSLDAVATEDLTPAALDTAQRSGCLSVVHLQQAWQEASGAELRLTLVTRGARSGLVNGEPMALAQTPLLGLGRVIVNEHPNTHVKMIDLCPTTSAGDAHSLCEELCRQDDEDEVALRGAGRYVHRYARVMPDEPLAAVRSESGSGDASPREPAPFRLEMARSGTLDGLTLRGCRRRPPDTDEVEIEVFASGLNFSDVMKALGLYPGLPDGPVPLGIECAGRIAAIGRGVDRFRVGDEVVALAPFSLGAFVTIGALLVAHKPQAICFEEAATIPIAFLTAYHALIHLGRLEPKERVLIHSAAGGVGLASIQIAQRAGAEVFATAGTPEKRQLLTALGVTHVMDSRSLEFIDEVIDRTGGRGVDVILNSLAGEAIPKGLTALADHGRFLEIGKRDIYGNSRLGLLPFHKNLSFIAIDLDRAIRERPEQIAAQFREVIDGFQQGTLSPLPLRTFPLGNVAGAFRHMAQGKHIGKIVLAIRDEPAKIAPSLEPTSVFRADATYLVTGGLGGFGLTTAQWMAEQGARHLVLVGRSGAATQQAVDGVKSLEAAGVRVMVAAADVADPAQLSAVLADIAREMPPLRGVIHAAMVLDDCLLMNLNHQRLDRVLRPKMHGAWNLHQQTLDLPLDFFVCFSSMSVVFGVAGQANYAAANMFLDALANYRHGLGLPALAINWGYLGKVGYVARNERVAELLESWGARALSPSEALTLLGRLLADEVVQAGVMRVDWARWRPPGASIAISPRFSELRAGLERDREDADSDEVSPRKAVLAAAPERRKELLQEFLCNKLARVLGSSAGQVDPEKALTDLGLDSLMAVELRNWIEGELEVNVPIVNFMQGLNVAGLAGLLLGQLIKEETAAPMIAEPLVGGLPGVGNNEIPSARAAGDRAGLGGANGEPIKQQRAAQLPKGLDDPSVAEVDEPLTAVKAD
jgi:NADPH:quinone reductase-like Zn-dependent oxidoreductase/acyl carrier protein